VQLSTIYEWLAWIGSVHNTEIDLGLERIRVIAERLGLLRPVCPVVVVGGTNGKGSVVAGLQAVYRAAGYRVGAFTSPYLFKHNEEVRVNGEMATDEAFCHAFARIEAARGEVTLTPFEYHTLAALLIFQQSNLDVMILEVGLGGRLDAVNVMDGDVAVVASIDIDHVAWLGDTRELIATEKAGIFRRGKPAICGDRNPPHTLIAAAQEMGTQFFQQGKDFNFTEMPDAWTWQCAGQTALTLPRNELLTQNMSTVLMAVSCLQSRLPVTEESIRRGLQQIELTGRMQIVNKPVYELYDVAHNPHAALELARRLRQLPVTGKTVAVFSMLADKDIAGTLAAMKKVIDEWYIAPLTCARAASLPLLEQAFHQAGIIRVTTAPTLAAAYQAAVSQTRPGDRIIIFGSFYAVAAIMTETGLVP